MDLDKLLADDTTLEEVWKPIKEYDGLYEVSNLGRVRSLTRVLPHKTFGTWTVKGKVMKTCLTGNGTQKYAGVCLRDEEGKTKCKKIHRLVAKTFIPNEYNKREVNHIDGVTLNNRVDNLEWVTPLENVHHAKKIGKLDFLYIGKTVVNLDTGETFKSCAEAGRKYGIGADVIGRCASGKQKHCAGFRWKFEEV